MAGARRAVELGYGITPDNGPSGRLGQWAIDGIPSAAMEIHSKRAAEINEAINERGTDTYRARQVAARATRDHKRHEAVEDLMVRWRAELEGIGYPVSALEASVAEASRTRADRPDVPSCSEVRDPVSGTVSFRFDTFTPETPSPTLTLQGRNAGSAA